MCLVLQLTVQMVQTVMVQATQIVGVAVVFSAVVEVFFDALPDEMWDCSPHFPSSVGGDDIHWSDCDEGVADAGAGPGADVDGGNCHYSSCPVEEKEPAPATAAFYIKRLDDPLYHGASMTLLEAIFANINHKHECNISDTAFNDMCRLKHEVSTTLDGYTTLDALQPE